MQQMKKAMDSEIRIKNEETDMKYQPTMESLRTHAVPDWYHNAKLGIMIHWGLYSVPA